MQILIKSSIIIIYTIYIELKQSIENLTKVISSVYAEVINLKKENKEMQCGKQIFDTASMAFFWRKLPLKSFWHFCFPMGWIQYQGR